MIEKNNMPNGWVETTLEEVVESANTGLDAIKRAPIVEEETGLKCFRIQDASQKKEFTNWGNTLVENKNYNKFKLIEGDILIARTGNTIGVHYLVKQNLKSVFNNGLIRLRANRKIDYKFLYKIIESGSFERFIQSIAYGTSTQPNMQINVLLSFKISLPPLPEQKSIAAILTAFDDKIELLQAQNKTLEELAQTLFKEWFGKYNIDDELPEGWREGKLGEEFEILMGQSPNGESYNTDKKGVVFFQGRAEFTERFPKNRLYTTEPKRLADKFDVLVSVRAPVGDINLASEICCIGRGLAAVKSKNKSYAFYKLKFLKSKFDLFEGEGTVFGSINKDSFNNIEVVIPPLKTIIEFEVLVQIIDDKIFHNHQQIQTLTKTRDALLPKLMSGEIRVKMSEL